MTWQLDAWLERSTPLLRILDSNTGIPIACFSGDEVYRLMEQGELTAEEVLSTDREERKVLAGRLFTLACGIPCG